VLDSADNVKSLYQAIHGQTLPDRAQRFEVDVHDFRAIPRCAFSYWASESIRRLFKDCPQLSTAAMATVGLQSSDDFRFLRLWWEPASASRFRHIVKGGRYSPFYSDVALLVKWCSSGEEIKAFAETTPGSKHWSRNIRSAEHYFRAGITFPARPQREGWFAAVPPGGVFSHNGPMVFLADSQLLPWLGLLNGSVFHYLVQLMMARGQGGSGQTLTYEVGMVARVPIPRAGADELAPLGNLAARAWKLRRSLDMRVEVSHAFVLPALLQVDGRSLAERADGWTGRVQAVEAELEEIQTEIDERCFDLYGIGDEDRRAISEGLAGATDDVEADEAGGEVDETDDEQEVEAVVDAAGLAADLVSWAVGVAFGRFDVRLATGERAMPDEPEPFDPLPACSPGMLVGEDGLPVAGRPPGYPIDFPESGLLVDDPGDPRDLVAAVRAVFDAVFGAGADARWDEVAALLDVRGHDLRAWLRASFFERHLKLHSKSRRKAPILWQLGTKSGRYSIWLYAHRLTDDSLFRVQSDVLAPKLAYEERQLSSLVQEAGGSPSARERRAIEAQEAFVEELRELLEEVRRVAPLWRPTLGDGIVLVMAPLCRLVPHKPWQRELKKKWGELVAGKYDWARLAMHLWPERVVAKCAEDRSLAIAHGLEDVFWFEDGDGKWQPRDEPTQDVEELVRERASVAVKEALGAEA
jgi:hypothetical protein